MCRNVRVRCVLLVSIVLLVAAPASPAGKKSAAKPDLALSAVEKVLRAETAGEVDRRGQLAETLNQQADAPAARWQAGFVRDGNSWRSFDSPLSAASTDELMAQYRSRRDDVPESYDRQLGLANWCRKQGLHDQERAHLWTALWSCPDGEQAEILHRLGHRTVGGVWLSSEDLRDWFRQNQQTEAALKRWETKLNKLARNLSGSARQRDEAARQLREIADPASIPAIELTLAGDSEESALVAVHAFTKFEGPVAALALAKQAVFSHWPEVRRAAVQSLKLRNPDDFAPSLIALLATPIRTQVRWRACWGSSGSGSGSGVLLFSYVLARETDRQFQVATFQSANFLVNAWVDGMVVDGPSYRASRGNNAADFGLARGENDALRATAEATEINERTVAELNERTVAINRRIGDVLSAISGREASVDPVGWWNWWSQYSDLQQVADKHVVSVGESEVIGNPNSGFRILSCFAAGTPVWTESGARAIETIKVGDRVLAKDVETGELAYKPVLRTTVRPPKELTTLRFGDETIVCTGGHRFWNSGSGWIKARELTPQTLLHTVTGNTPVWSARKGSTAETYNLVVADFHTYFVGKTGVLCQDLLIPRSTNNVVPGLSRAVAVTVK
jgi:hypothetical protein